MTCQHCDSPCPDNDMPTLACDSPCPNNDMPTLTCDSPNNDMPTLTCDSPCPANNDMLTLTCDNPCPNNDMPTLTCHNPCPDNGTDTAVVCGLMVYSYICPKKILPRTFQLQAANAMACWRLPGLYCCMVKILLGVKEPVVSRCNSWEQNSHMMWTADLERKKVSNSWVEMNRW